MKALKKWKFQKQENDKIKLKCQNTKSPFLWRKDMRAATWIHILPNRIKSHESFEILVWERGVSVGGVQDCTLVCDKNKYLFHVLHVLLKIGFVVGGPNLTFCLNIMGLASNPNSTNGITWRH